MSHFAFDLKDIHTFALDTSVVFSDVNPGVPILFISTSYVQIDHFGAVTTILPDSTTLVLRVAPNHPLNLMPGDIILGYEGIPWKNLVKELMNTDLPMFAITGGCKSADNYHNLMGVGLNWHLFSTIDILKYSSGDTVHLSLEPMVGFHFPPMVNNEQMPIANIPFPRMLFPKVSDTLVTYGIMENTNFGYIYLSGHMPDGYAENQFYEAVNSLKNTEAMIIDMRYNISGGAYLNRGLEILFNETQKTLDRAHRCSSNTFKLCPDGNTGEFQINAKDPDYYDRPIAVLLGPGTMTRGEMTAYRLKYHPMVRTFGASPYGSLGSMAEITLKDWILDFTDTDLYSCSDPGKYLKRKAFPVDEPVWFNKDDVAKGVDPIVEKSLDWIKNLAYGNNVTTDKWMYASGKDTVKVQATIKNPNGHQISAQLIFDNLDGTLVDSAEMVNLITDVGDQWQATWIVPENQEKTYWVSIKVNDLTDGTSFNTKHATRITTVPFLVDSLPCTSKATTKFTFQAYLKNAGKSTQINSITFNVASNDVWVKGISPQKIYCTYLKPGQIAKTTPFNVSYDAATYPGYINLKLTISSDGWPYWVKDTTITMPTGIKSQQSLPVSHCLDQNFPNPFNSSTTIGWQLAQSTKATIKVFDLVGREVSIPVNEQRPAGNYETEFNAGTLPKGVYFYQLKAGEFVQTRKMILLK
jgi:hypothetical protein